jgi:hypothetical protein
MWMKFATLRFASVPVPSPCLESTTKKYLCLASGLQVDAMILALVVSLSE